MEIILALAGAIIGATSVWAVNMYRARVDDQSAINRLMLVRRLACAEELCALSFEATREMMRPKDEGVGRERWDIAYEEAEDRARRLLEEMWEVIDTFGVYFREEEFKSLVDIPDLFVLSLRAERAKAAAGEGGVDDWDWRESFLEGQGLVRDDVRTICMRSLGHSPLKDIRSRYLRKGSREELKLREQYNKAL